MEALAPGAISTPRFSPHCSRCSGTSIFRGLAGFRSPGSLQLAMRSALRSLPSPSSALSPSPSSMNGHVDPSLESDLVEVIGIGGRKDSVIDFCLSSPSLSSARLRFWTIQLRDSLKVQLLQRCHGTGALVRDVEFPLSLRPCPPALILVASSGLGLDHITAIELLNAVKSSGALAVAVILKPFNFEGQRRREEVDDLVDKLKDCLHIRIVVEADSLLKKELETFAEAFETVNNAAILAIKTISVMMSATYTKLWNSVNGQIKELGAIEVVKVRHQLHSLLLQSYGEAKVGFGAGYDIKSAVRQAVSCPFLSDGIKDLNCLVIFTLMSASDVDKHKLLSAVRSFRQISKCRSDIILSGIQEPHLEPNSVVITLLILSCNKKIVPQEKSFLLGLARQFRFLSSLMGIDLSEPNGDIVHSSAPMEACSPSDSGTVSRSMVNGAVESSNTLPNKVENQVSPIEKTSEDDNGFKSSDCSHDSYMENSADINQQPDTRNDGPAFNIAQLWAKDRVYLNATSRVDEVETFSLPVGVKPCTSFSGHSSHPNLPLRDTSHDSNLSKASLGDQDFTSRDAALTDAGLGVILEIYNSALSLIKGRNLNESRNGMLSARAVSMLEAERESQKSWNPVTETQYRGGTYRGRCQGGLPEGKGRLTFLDGSYYDGMWRIGKRCGVGTLCYSNGDLFQGSWRDDLMHGKGWLYFQSGDRWFANFWKGKANGEGRFYSKNGSMFIGHFKNGWRHGHSLFIDIDGSRWNELWDDGVLVSRSQLDTEAL